MSPISIPAISRKVAQAELEMVRAFRAGAEEQFAREELRLTRAAVQGEVDTQYEDFLADQYTIAEELLELANELAVVATYRIVELNAKRLARFLDKSYTKFTWPTFDKLLSKRTRVRLEQVKEAAVVDELRLLSNAIKHESKVTKDLSKYPRWEVGNRVHPLADHLKRFEAAVPDFVESLAREIVPVELGGNRQDLKLSAE